MKINFTNSEFRLLLDLMYMADWILHSHDSEGRTDTLEYSELFQKIMSYARDFGYEELVDFDKDLNIYSETATFEAESAALEYIDEFENESFWDELISRLAHRDALTEINPNQPHAVETAEALFSAISRAEEQWSKEFEVFGLTRIRLNKSQLDTVH